MPEFQESSDRTSAHDSETREVSTWEVIELRLDRAAEYEGLQLRWLEVGDSRCPKGVQCVSAGQVTATLEAATDQEEAVEVELVLRIGREPETTEVFGFVLELRSVDPEPKAGTTPPRSSYLARVAVATR